MSVFTKNFKQRIKGVTYNTKTAYYILSYNWLARVYMTPKKAFFFHCVEGDREWIKPCTPEAIEVLRRCYGLKYPSYYLRHKRKSF